MAGPGLRNPQAGTGILGQVTLESIRKQDLGPFSTMESRLTLDVPIAL